MSVLQLNAPWEEVKNLLMEAVPQLTEDDLQYTPGEDDRLINRLAEKMKRTPEQIKGWIESVSQTSGKAS
jgi:hypothetical protein